jgi:low affinity Fe/Cu permease
MTSSRGKRSIAAPIQTAPLRIGFFERVARRATEAAGSTTAFILALTLVVGWALSGWFFDFGESWQLFINTLTTIATFLMVFLIQRAQNKDAMALHLKLNELIASQRGASNRLVNAEDFGEEELRVLHRHFDRLHDLALEAGSLHESHSIDEARDRHEAKRPTGSHRASDDQGRSDQSPA